MLEIRVVSRAGVPLDAPLSARFGPDGGDIGRGADCTLVLPDPERRISRHQAVITARAERYFIRSVGSGSPVEIDGRTLAPDADAALEAGAQIRIGGYLLEVAPPPARDDPLAMLEAEAKLRRFGAFADLLDAAEPSPAAVEVDVVVGDSGVRLVDPFDELFAGLGVPALGPAARTPQQLRVVGELLRALIGGTLELLAARNVAKRELGAGVTQLLTRHNNPLKFSPDVDAALALLLGPPQRGFIAPVLAVQDAFADLRAHQIAVLAGMRAALEAVLARFDPQTLEQRLAPAGLLDQLLPANRKAKLWEQYGVQYADIVGEAEGDFETLFGRAFLQAYEKQIAQLAAPPDADPEVRR
jgi:FHA domain-containing protein